MVKFCRNCSQQIDDNAKFCHKCGKSTAESEQPCTKQNTEARSISEIPVAQSVKKKSKTALLIVLGITTALVLVVSLFWANVRNGSNQNAQAQESLSPMPEGYYKYFKKEEGDDTIGLRFGDEGIEAEIGGYRGIFKYYDVSANKNSGLIYRAEYIGDLAGTKAFLIKALGEDVAEVEFITHEDKMAQYNGVYIAVNKD